jgi:CBS domain-containing protein
MKVRDVMTKHPVYCTAETTLEAAARLMASCDCGALPVLADPEGFPLGIITDRDMAVRGLARGEGPSAHVRECMTMPAITITDDADLDDCIDLLEERQIRRVIVVDDTGRCIGILAQADIATHASKRKAGKLLRYVSQPSATPMSPLY